MTNASKLALAAAALALGVLALRLPRDSSADALRRLALAPEDERASNAEDAASAAPSVAEHAPREVPAEAGSARTSAAGHFVIQGVVRDEHGTPIPGAKILAEGVLGKAFGAIAGKRGDFGFRALAPGRWTIRASAAGHLDMTRPLLLEGTPRVEPLELVLAREPRLVVYVLTPAGDPHPETIGRDMTSLLAIATSERPSAPLTTESRPRSPLGIWKHAPGLDGLLGEFEIQASSDYFVSLVFGEAVLATEQVRRGASAVVFELDPWRLEELSASVTMRFLGLDGAPFPRTMTSLEGASGARASQLVPADGRMSFLALAPDTYRLKLGSGLLRRDFRLGPGEELDLGDQVVGAGAGLRVHVVAPGPMRHDLHVTFGREELDESESWRVTDGSALIRSLEPGRHVVGMSEKGRPPDQHARIASVEVTADALAEVTLHLEPVGWLVLKPEGDGALGTRYRVIDEGTGLVNRRGGIDATQSLRLPLPQGAWLLQLVTPSGLRIDKPLFVGAEPVTVTLPR